MDVPRPKCTSKSCNWYNPRAASILRFRVNEFCLWSEEWETESSTFVRSMPGPERRDFRVHRLGCGECQMVEAQDMVVLSARPTCSCFPILVALAKLQATTIFSRGGDCQWKAHLSRRLPNCLAVFRTGRTRLVAIFTTKCIPNSASEPTVSGSGGRASQPCRRPHWYTRPTSSSSTRKSSPGRVGHTFWPWRDRRCAMC